MTDRLDLPERYRRQIVALVQEHLPGVEVWAYGSRINGRGHEASDLDLVLRGPGLKPIAARLLAGFADMLTESNVPILVQAHDWSSLPEHFRQEIQRDYVVLVRAPAEIPVGPRG